jgi:hypothetical protein
VQPLQALKQGATGVAEIARERFGPFVKRYASDMALGALVAAVSLALFLVLKLL